MLEILALVFLTRSIGTTAERKGLKPGTWKLYTVLAWFAGEFLGFLIGIAIFGSENILMSLLIAIPCAIGGYHIVRTILNNKPDVFGDELDQIGENLQS